ncbi:MAG: hypothetical protein RMJ84_12970, partial [Sandaracinaceae bacterium]|nr:hypothetical protein [Sandaracinaceae bacterium]
MNVKEERKWEKVERLHALVNEGVEVGEVVVETGMRDILHLPKRRREEEPTARAVGGGGSISS